MAQAVVVLDRRGLCSLPGAGRAWWGGVPSGWWGGVVDVPRRVIDVVVLVLVRGG